MTIIQENRHLGIFSSKAVGQPIVIPLRGSPVSIKFMNGEVEKTIELRPKESIKVDFDENEQSFNVQFFEIYRT